MNEAPSFIQFKHIKARISVVLPFGSKTKKHLRHPQVFYAHSFRAL